MIVDAAVAMLACARIGAIHSVVFGGFAPNSIADRVRDCGAKAIITADEGCRRAGRSIPLKANVDAALQMPGHGKRAHRAGGEEHRHAGRHDAGACDYWLTPLMERESAECEPERMNAEDPLFILYTSGSTGKPKGVLHTSGGYLLYAAYTHEAVFDLREDDIYWCTADVGWVTGHSYIVYGPLANGATSLMFEGVPNYPDTSRFWNVIDKHKVTIFYTAPTAIRALMREGTEPVLRTARSSLRLLGSVGEPINPEAWRWYHDVVGAGRCPIVDTWWQTETGGILISPLPGAKACKPGAASTPFYGIRPELVDVKTGALIEGAGEGNLYIRSPAGPARSIYGDEQRYFDSCFKRISRHVLHRRRLPPRRRRLLLDHRPRRRCDQRVRPPHRHRRSGKRAGLAPEGGRSGRGRLPARREGPGHLRLRHAEGGHAGIRNPAPGTGGPRAAKSARSPRRTTCSGHRACRRPARARSCAASCARSPTTPSTTWATSPRWPIRRSSGRWCGSGAWHERPMPVLLIADDHPLFREALRGVIDDAAGQRRP